MSRENLHSELDRFLDQREAHEVDPLGSSGLDRLRAEFSRLAAAIAGDLFEGKQVNSGGDEDAGAWDKPLADYSWRLRFLSPVLDIDGGLATHELADELLAIAHGDAPRLLRRRTVNGSAKAFNAARWKLGALLWSARLERLGVATATRQGWIAEAYGTPWDTISRWMAQVEQRLGADEVQRAFSMDRYFSHLAATAPDYAPAPLETLRAEVLETGRAYLTFQGFAGPENGG